MMAESNTNLLTSIDETQTSSLGRSDRYDTPCRHSDLPVTSGDKIPPAESFETSCIKHMQHVDCLHQMIMEEEAKVHDEKQIVVYVDAEKKWTNHNGLLTRLADERTVFYYSLTPSLLAASERRKLIGKLKRESQQLESLQLSSLSTSHHPSDISGDVPASSKYPQMPFVVSGPVDKKKKKGSAAATMAGRREWQPGSSSGSRNCCNVT
jgi:hypothetical protein